jgi:predicted TIM-barrel fold metal-dependent hydrolase
MHHLDYGLRAFKRTEEPLRRLENKPSDYVRRHLKFTPFPGEDVGWMIDAAGAELFMFSTDYPHPEGSKDPLAKFEETLTDVGEETKDRFFYSNMAELLHGTGGVGAQATVSVTGHRHVGPQAGTCF